MAVISSSALPNCMCWALRLSQPDAFPKPCHLLKSGRHESCPCFSWMNFQQAHEKQYKSKRKKKLFDLTSSSTLSCPVYTTSPVTDVKLIELGIRYPSPVANIKLADPLITEPIRVRTWRFVPEVVKLIGSAYKAFLSGF